MSTLSPTFSRPAAAIGTGVVGLLPLYLIAALAPVLHNTYNFTTGHLGIATAAYFLISAMASPIFGLAAQIRGPWMQIAWVHIVAGLSITALGFSQHAFHVIAIETVGGLGNAMSQPSINAILVRHIPRHRLGAMFGIKQSVFPISSALAGSLVPLALNIAGWRIICVITGVCVAVVGAYMAFTYSSQHGPCRNTRLRWRAASRDSESYRLVTKRLILLVIGGSAGSSATNSLTAFFVDSVHRTGAALSTAITMFTMLSVLAVVMRIAVGFALDRHGARPRIGFTALVLVVGSIGFGLMAFGQRDTMAAGAIIAFGIGWAWMGVYQYSLTVLYPWAAAAVTGIAQLGLSLGGSIGPLVIGLVASSFGYAAAWLTTSMVAMIGATLLLAAHAAYREHTPPIS